MKKSPLSLLLVTLIIVSLVLVSTVNFSKAQSGTNVTGIISVDTTWTQANSPYTFTGPVAINAGVTLTIQAGVIINLGGNNLVVNGTLVARGTSENRIQFNSTNLPNTSTSITFTSISNGWNEQTGSGSIIQYADLAYTGLILNSPAKIDHNTLNWRSELGYLIYADYGVISNNTLRSPDESTIITCGGNASVLNNTVIGGRYGGIAVSKGSPIVQGNLVIGNSGAGGSIFSGGGIYVINGNTNGNSNTALIEGNTVTGNYEGITVSNWGGNTQIITPTILNNNIYGNQHYNLYYNLAYGGNVTYNWWGTTDTQSINQTIYDFKNNYNVQNASFVPFLTAPNTDAPTYINASTGSDGSIAPSGIIMANYGGSQTFTITPDSGYHIADVLVNGTSVGAVNSYPMQNVNGATTISATFALDPTPTPTPSPTPSPTLTVSSTATPTASPTTNPTSSSTATTSPSPTPTVPELSTLAVLAIFIASSLFAVAMFTVRKRKIAKKLKQEYPQ